MSLALEEHKCSDRAALQRRVAGGKLHAVEHITLRENTD